MNSSLEFQSPIWLVGGHAQTIWAAKFSRTRPCKVIAPVWKRARWATPDDDFIDVDTIWGQIGAPHIILFHGLEGSSKSHYAQAWAHVARQANWTLRVVHFRGCSGEINRAPRAYHSGDARELDWVLKRVTSEARGAPCYAVGYSLGGNALANWLGSMALLPGAAPIKAACVLAAPLDLVAAGCAIERGLNRWIYTPMFLATMRQKAKEKWQQYPRLFDLKRVLCARTIREFDDAFTAPLHGFKGVEDYWKRASAKPLLANIQIPTWIINARNDPFVPAHSVIQGIRMPDAVVISQPQGGGHAGFAQFGDSTDWRGELFCLPHKVLKWFRGHNPANG